MNEISGGLRPREIDGSLRRPVASVRSFLTPRLAEGHTAYALAGP